MTLVKEYSIHILMSAFRKANFLNNTPMFHKKIVSLLILVLNLLLASCNEHNEACDEYRGHLFRHHFSAVITDKGPEGRHFVVEGVDPITHKTVIFSGDNSIYIVIRENMEIGDTLVKAMGESLFTIKGKKSNVLVDFDCKRIDFVNVYPKWIKKDGSNLLESATN